MAVEIVSTPDTCSGRWRFAGTRLWASIPKIYIDRGRAWLKEQWPDLTDEMIDAAVAWDFPPNRDTPRVSVEDVDVQCVCSDDTYTDVAASRSEVDRIHVCRACGKRWRVTVTVEAAE